jgi:hypothetical protein
MTILLRLKHWHLSLVFCAGFAGQIFWVLAASSISVPTLYTTNLIYIVPVTAMLTFIVRTLWHYTLARELRKKHPAELQMNATAFMIVLFAIVAYRGFVLFVFIAGSFADVGGVMSTLRDVTSRTAMAGVELITVATYLSGFYFAYFLSKSLVLADSQKKVSFGDHLGMLFAFVFYPIGVWFIQPRVNRLFANDIDYNSHTPLDQQVTFEQ